MKNSSYLEEKRLAPDHKLSLYEATLMDGWATFDIFIELAFLDKTVFDSKSWKGYLDHGERQLAMEEWAAFVEQNEILLPQWLFDRYAEIAGDDSFIERVRPFIQKDS